MISFREKEPTRSMISDWFTDYGDALVDAMLRARSDLQIRYATAFEQPLQIRGQLSELPLCMALDRIPPPSGMRLQRGRIETSEGWTKIILGHRWYETDNRLVVLDPTAGQAAPNIDLFTPEGEGIRYIQEHAPQYLISHGPVVLLFGPKLEIFRDLHFDYIAKQ